MSLFRHDEVPSGLIVGLPDWPRLEAEPGARLVEAPLAGPASDEPRLADSDRAPDPAQEAAAILDQARLEAADMLQHAATEAEEAVAAARQEGFAAGREEGLAAGRAELDLQCQQAEWNLEKARLQAQATLDGAEAEARTKRAEAEAQAQALLGGAREEAARLVAEGRAQQGQLLDDAHSAVVELAIAAAVRLVQGHLAIQPAAIAAMVAAGLRRLKDSDCTVRVHPQELPLLHAQRSALERELGAGSLKLLPDSGLTTGGFTIQSTHGTVDGTLEQQSSQLRNALTAALGGD
jgi:flagellar assembly protein FliH